jgi:signal transduction histidine kinase
MNWTSFLSSPWPYLVTAVLAVVTGWYVWKQPLRPGTRYFRWLVLVWFVWSLVAALHNLTSLHQVRYVLWVTQAVCPLLGPPLVLMSVLEYTGNGKWLKHRSLNLLFLPALLIILISFFPSAVSLSEVHTGVQVFRGSGLVRWGFYAYYVVLTLVTLAVLFACLLRAPAFWAPIWLLILGRVIPMVGYLLPNPQQLSVPPVQSGLLFLGVTMVLYFIALYSFQILQVSPVARDTVIAHMPYALLVLDAEDRLVDFNTAVKTLPQAPEKLFLRQPVAQQLPGWWERLTPLSGLEPVSKDVFVLDGVREHIFRVTSLPLKQASGWRIGQAFLLEDVTQARRAEQQQAQAQRVVATVQERERLARELHDELAQELALINIQAQLADDLLAQGRVEQAREQVQLLARQTRQAQLDVRGEISKLLYRNAAGEDFLGALKRFIDTFQQTYGIETQFVLPNNQPEVAFEAATEVQLLRIVQESLTNVRKHAQATRVRVVFTSDSDCTQLVIEDNGIGFDAEHLPAGRQSYGLGIISERAKEFEGQASVVSTLGQGTRIVVTIPVNGNGKIRDREMRRHDESFTGG